MLNAASPDLPQVRPALVVTSVPATLGHLGGHAPFLSNPSGFSPRLYHFLAALARRRPVDLVGVHLDPLDLGNPFFDPDLDVRHYHPMLAGPPPMSRPGLRGGIARWRQFLFAALPATCHPRRLPELDHLLGIRRHDLVVLYLPHLAHLAAGVPRGVPVVCALEEGWDRFEALGIDDRDAGRLRKAWINTSEGWRAAHLYRRVAGRASAVSAISELERDWFARDIPREQIAIVPHGVDCDYFRPAPSASEDLDVAIFGLLFQPRNGEPAAGVWRAAATSASRAPWRWAFVGPTSDAFCASVASSRSLVTGYVADVRPYYGRAKVVLVPSTRGTGVKTTVLQAWAMGRPVVASPFALTGLPARPGDNVLVGHTPEAIVSQARRLLASAELRRRIGAAGRETVLRSRDITTIARQFADLCETAVVGSPRGTEEA